MHGESAQRKLISAVVVGLSSCRTSAADEADGKDAGNTEQSHQDKALLQHIQIHLQTLDGGQTRIGGCCVRRHLGKSLLEFGLAALLLNYGLLFWSCRPRRLSNCVCGSKSRLGRTVLCPSMLLWPNLLMSYHRIDNILVATQFYRVLRQRRLPICHGWHALLSVYRVLAKRGLVTWNLCFGLLCDVGRLPKERLVFR